MTTDLNIAGILSAGSRIRNARRILYAVAVMLGLVSSGWAQGRIEGTITTKDDNPVGAVVIVVQENNRAVVSDTAGRYVFDDLPARAYTLVLRLGDHELQETVMVTSGVAAVHSVVDWPLAFAETVTVVGVSKHVERIVESPAAVSRISADDLSNEATDSQLPRRLASLPGVELTQSNLYTFSLNTRGFNTLNGRHLPMFIDGRDPSTPVVLGNQEWGTLSVPIDQLASIEVVRGPAAALYGSGAFSGVVDVITKAPADTLGGQLRATFGGLDTRGVEGHYSAKAGKDWWYRASGSTQASSDFARSRVSSVEYAGLANEAVPLPDDTIKLMSGSVRVDHVMGSKSFAFETGDSRAQNITAVTSTGRSFSTDVRRPWARANASWPGWNANVFYSGRDANRLVNLGGGGAVYLAESNVGGELQHHRFFSKGRTQLVAGASFARQGVNSVDPSGAQTVFSSSKTARQGALFAQIDWKATSRVKAVASGRWDVSNLHQGRFSPRAALVVSPKEGHTLRASYSNAFQSPSLVEFFLRTPIAAPVNLSSVESALAPQLGGTSLGFASIPVLAVGNPHMKVERIETYEGGYTGTIGQHLMATADVFYNRRHDFTTNLIPEVGSSLGRVNPDFQVYAPPSALPASAVVAVNSALSAALPANLLAALSNDASGKPVIAMLSFGNFGETRDHGAELELTAWVRPSWRIEVSDTWMSFKVLSQSAESVISPNTPSQQFKIGTTFNGRRVSGSLQMRAVRGFDWASGVYVGRVPTYGLVDASAGYKLHAHWRIEADASNLLNHPHYEAFGGSLLGRRILGSLVFNW